MSRFVPTSLRDDVELFVREQKAAAFTNMSVGQDTTVDGGWIKGRDLRDYRPWARGLRQFVSNAAKEAPSARHSAPARRP